MYCPKHPRQKMTLLLNNYVCDICDPPSDYKNASLERKEDDFLIQEEVNKILRDLLGGP